MSKKRPHSIEVETSQHLHNLNCTSKNIRKEEGTGIKGMTLDEFIDEEFGTEGTPIRQQFDAMVAEKVKALKRNIH